MLIRYTLFVRDGIIVYGYVYCIQESISTSPKERRGEYIASTKAAVKTAELRDKVSVRQKTGLGCLVAWAGNANTQNQVRTPWPDRTVTNRIWEIEMRR